MRAIYREDGLKGFFRGMSLPLAGTIIETSCLFTTNGVLKRMLSEAGHIAPDQELPMQYVAISGAGTGFVVSWVLTPTELVKCRLQVPPPRDAPAHLHYSGPIDCLTKSIRHEGLRVLYRGHAGTLLREVPGTMFWFAAYEMFVRAMTPPGTRREDLHSSTIIAGGALGGMAYWAVMYPCDTVKSAMQIMHDDGGASVAAAASSSSSNSSAAAAAAAEHRLASAAGGNAPAAASSARYLYPSAAAPGAAASSLASSAAHGAASSSSSAAAMASAAAAPLRRAPLPGFTDVLMAMYARGGLRGLYMGFLPTIVRAAPSNAAIFYVYEASAKQMRHWTGWNQGGEELV
jgi:hypothetical protein